MFGLDALWFKPAANGWVFRSPQAWAFGDQRNYLITDAQKLALQPLLKHGLGATICLIGLGGGLLASLKDLFQSPNAGLLISFAIVLMSVAMMGVIIVICVFVSDRIFFGRWLGHLAEAILKDAVRTDDSFTLSNAIDRQNQQRPKIVWIMIFAGASLVLVFEIVLAFTTDLASKQADAILAGLFIPVLIIAVIKVARQK